MTSSQGQSRSGDVAFITTWSSMAFREAAEAGKRELVVRREGLGDAEAAAVESGRDESIFSITTLNHLQLTGFAGLCHVSPKISQLPGLLQLILTHNALQDLPVEIHTLSILKHLDVSHNRLSTIPQALYHLPALHTLILGHNQLTNASFPPLPDDQILPGLHHVDLTDNQLTELPPFVYRCTSISELLAADNAIAELAPAVGSLSSLRQLEMKRNNVAALPFELTNCGKLKALGLEDNPLKDRRLMKLIAQHAAQKPKAVLDYIASHAPRPAASAKPSGKKKGGKKAKSAAKEVQVKEDSDSDVEFSQVNPVIRVLRPREFVEINVSPEARKVRPYLVCAVVRGLALGEEVAFKEFISLQTKLHDTVCKRRRVATIATHDLSKISLPLSYKCAPADAITIVPLGGSSLVTVQEFLDYLEANRADKGGGRKAKPDDPVAAGLSKYLGYVNPSKIAYIADGTDQVISLPPLTNSDATKVEHMTTDILVEVISGDSLASAKLVMEALLEGLVSCQCVRGELCVEQVRVVEDGQLLVLYPSRTDLSNDKFDVIRQ